jgi:spore photoproduct lyase
MSEFHPQTIYLDPAVRDLPHTQRILARFPQLAVQEVADKRAIKQPIDHGRAKKQLYLTAFRGEPLKSCQGMGDYVCCQYFTIALVSDCHLECTYCILQDYLKNNPVITVYTNVEEVLARVRERVLRQPERLFRIGTGELSDSLALDDVTGLSRDYVAVARVLPNVLLELKTKTDRVAGLLGLDHGGRTVVSWSVNPQKYIDSDEHKCASLTARLQAARRCADDGYPVGFHLDPLLYLEDWENQYATVIKRIAALFMPSEIAWVSVGSLRFTTGLKAVAQARFPRSRLYAGEMFPSADGKVRYFRPLREAMYRTVTGLLKKHLAHVPQYLCMETKPVWRSVYGELPAGNAQLEARLTAGFPV